jgi:hypothetical protein
MHTHKVDTTVERTEENYSLQGDQSDFPLINLE